MNFDDKDPFDCGLGCQLHVISAGILCATEMNKKYLVIGNKGNYEKYFRAFEPYCSEINDENNRKLGKKFFFKFEKRL